MNAEQQIQLEALLRQREQAETADCDRVFRESAARWAREFAADPQREAMIAEAAEHCWTCDALVNGAQYCPQCGADQIPF